LAATWRGPDADRCLPLTKAESRVLAFLLEWDDAEVWTKPTSRGRVEMFAGPLETWTSERVLNSLARKGLIPARSYEHNGETVVVFDEDALNVSDWREDYRAGR